jgi:diacylglycerol kinase
MKKNARFYHSFINAFRGIVRTLRTERNFRIHIAVAVVVITLACFYGLDQTGWLFLAAAITSVLAAELLNTSIENACDAQTDEYNEKIRFAKDAAAGGVLLAAAGAVAVGICLFGDLEKLCRTVQNIWKNPAAMTAVCVVMVFDVILLVFGGKK